MVMGQVWVKPGRKPASQSLLDLHSLQCTRSCNLGRSQELKAQLKNSSHEQGPWLRCPGSAVWGTFPMAASRKAAGSCPLPKSALTPSSQTPRRRDAFGALQVPVLTPQPSAHFHSYLSIEALLK